MDSSSCAPLNVAVVGDADSGKTTLCVQLLHNLGVVSTKQLNQALRDSKRNSRTSYQYAFVLDKSRKERSFVHTIDCHICHFTLPSLRPGVNFTLIDTPGFNHYIKNTIRGLNLCDAVLVVASSLKGVFEASVQGWQTSSKPSQSPATLHSNALKNGKLGQVYHACYMAHRLGIKQILVAVNKLDDPTINYSHARFEYIKSTLLKMLLQLGFKPKYVAVVPVSAYYNENLSTRKERLFPWYKGFETVRNRRNSFVDTTLSKSANKQGAQTSDISNVSNVSNVCRGYTLLDAIARVLQLPKRAVNAPFRMQVYKKVYQQANDDKNARNDWKAFDPLRLQGARKSVKMAFLADSDESKQQECAASDGMDEKVCDICDTSATTCVVVGAIEKGVVCVQDVVCLVCAKLGQEPILCTIVSIEHARTRVGKAQSGEIVGLELDCVSTGLRVNLSDFVESGDWIFSHSERVVLGPKFKFAASLEAILFLFRSSRNVGDVGSDAHGLSLNHLRRRKQNLHGVKSYMESLQLQQFGARGARKLHEKSSVYKRGGRVKYCLNSQKRRFGGRRLKCVEKFGWRPVVFFGHKRVVCELTEIKWKIRANTAVRDAHDVEDVEGVRQKVNNPDFVESGFQALVTLELMDPAVVLPFEDANGKTGRVLMFEDRYLCGICKVLSVKYEPTKCVKNDEIETKDESNVEKNVQQAETKIERDETETVSSDRRGKIETLQKKQEKVEKVEMVAEKNDIDLRTLIERKDCEIERLKKVIAEKDDKIAKLERQLVQLG